MTIRTSVATVTRHGTTHVVLVHRDQPGPGDRWAYIERLSPTMCGRYFSRVDPTIALEITCPDCIAGWTKTKW